MVAGGTCMIEKVNTLFVSLFLVGLLSCSAATAAPSPDCTDFHSNDRLDSHSRRWCQALAFKESYLESGFVENLPISQGNARGVTSWLTTSSSSFGAFNISGTVAIEELTRRYRLKLAHTSDYKRYGKVVQVSGTARSGDGPLEIYSVVDVDLWKRAAVLVDNPVRGQEPPEEGLILKGYLRTEVTPGTDQEFTATLATLGADFYLLLVAPDGTARDIHLELEKP